MPPSRRSSAASAPPSNRVATVSFAEIGASERYKLLCATIVPRPIALVSTVDASGVVNAAPFSFFNVFAEEPPLVVLGLQHKPDRNRKDTTRNIAETGVFAVNLVDEALAEAMNVCAVDFPPERSEIDAAGLSLSPGIDIPVPHIVEAPFALECRRTASLAVGPDREIVIGEGLRGVRACELPAEVEHPQAGQRAAALGGVRGPPRGTAVDPRSGVLP